MIRYKYYNSIRREPAFKHGLHAALASSDLRPTDERIREQFDWQLPPGPEKLHPLDVTTNGGEKPV